jgi:hypothetical protein
MGLGNANVLLGNNLMKLYIGLAKPLLLVVYLPLVLIGLVVLFSKVKSWQNRTWAIPLYLIVAYAIPLGDVTLNSWNMAKVCPKAGLHIYRTVEVDGFLGEYANVDTMRKYPYAFLENKPFSDYPKVDHFERSDGQIINKTISKPTAEWEIIRDPFNYPDKLLGVTVDGLVIRNRYTGEVIAEYFAYIAWQGWLDAWIASVIDNSAGVCYQRPEMSDKFQEILIPLGAKQ